MVCSHIWDRWNGRAAVVPEEFYRKELGGLQEVLGGFVEERVREFPPQSQRVIKRIFAELFTARGRGRLVNVTSLYEQVKDDVASEEALRRDILEPLDRDHRLITIRLLKNVLYCEPIHDTLSQKANQWRQEFERERLEQRLREEHAAKRKKRRLLLVLAGAGILLASGALAGFIRYWAKTAELARSAKLAAADSTVATGDSLLLHGDYGVALQKFEETLSTYEGLGEKRRAARTLIDIGRVYVFQRDTARARDFFTRAQQLSQTTGDQVAEGEALERLGSLSELEGNVQEALPFYTRSQETYEAGGDLQASARVLERLAQQADETQQFAEAEQLYKQALRTYTATGDQLGTARVQTAVDRIVALHVPGVSSTSRTRRCTAPRKDMSTAGTPPMSTAISGFPTTSFSTPYHDPPRPQHRDQPEQRQHQRTATPYGKRKHWPTAHHRPGGIKTFQFTTSRLPPAVPANAGDPCRQQIRTYGIWRTRSTRSTSKRRVSLRPDSGAAQGEVRRTNQTADCRTRLTTGASSSP
jgi:tetratricopeptide (TPR) repeat protein